MRVTKKIAKKKKRDITRYVQGAWLKLDDQQILKTEAKKAGLRSPTNLASKILKDWIDAKRIEQAREIIREADNGKEEEGSTSPVGGDQAASVA